MSEMGDEFSLSLLKRFLREALSERKVLFVVLASIVGSAIANIALPYLLSIAIDRYIILGRYEKLGLIAVLYLLALVGQWFFSTLQTFYTEVFGQEVLRNLRAKLHEKALVSNLDFLQRQVRGEQGRRDNGLQESRCPRFHNETP